MLFLNVCFELKFIFFLFK